MAKRLNMFLLVLLCVVGAYFQSSEAQTIHMVGNTTGWRIPSGGSATYATWASKQTFVVGDVLVFNFVGGTHDVAEVTMASFESCTTSKPISSVTTTPANVTLSSAGDHYFVCTFSGHCDAGQKLALTVSAATSPPPSTTATSSPSSTASLSAMTFPVILFSIVIGLLFH